MLRNMKGIGVSQPSVTSLKRDRARFDLNGLGAFEGVCSVLAHEEEQR